MVGFVGEFGSGDFHYAIMTSVPFYFDDFCDVIQINQTVSSINVAVRLFCCRLSIKLFNEQKSFTKLQSVCVLTVSFSFICQFQHCDVSLFIIRHNHWLAFLPFVLDYLIFPGKFSKFKFQFLINSFSHKFHLIFIQIDRLNNWKKKIFRIFYFFSTKLRICIIDRFGFNAAKQFQTWQYLMSKWYAYIKCTSWQSWIFFCERSKRFWKTARNNRQTHQLSLSLVIATHKIPIHFWLVASVAL